MRVLVRLSVFATVVLAATAFLQYGTAQSQPPEEPKNLKVLPKDMSRREVVGIMRGFSHALGVRCVECHVSKVEGSDRPEDMDFASDDKPDKETARKMMKMVASINDQIGQMGRKDPIQVGCVTCHHGVKEPRTLSAILTKTATDKGADAAIERYRKLRDDYYGSGAYDFSPDALNEAAGNLAQTKKDFDGAIKLVQLNLEFAPKDTETYTMLGYIQASKGDKAAAVTAFEKAIELDPGNRRAKMQLEQLKGGQ
jgi:hypothetical protein